MLTDQVIERESYEYRGPLAEAVTGTGVTLIADWPVKGGNMRTYTSTVDHGSIAAAAEEIETYAVTGLTTTDKIVSFVAEDPNANVVPVGAKVTATDVVSVWLISNYGVTTATGTGTVVVNFTVFKRSSAS
jgi:hypothetical protein